MNPASVALHKRAQRARRSIARAPSSGLWALVEWCAARAPTAVVLTDDDGRHVDAATFRLRACRTASALARSGVAPGSAVAWQLPSTVEAMVLMAALARLGARQCPLLPTLGAHELVPVATELRPDAVVVRRRWRDVDYRALAETVFAPVGATVVAIDPALPEQNPVQPTLPAPADGGVRWIYYTSGTTGEPKGVQHTDRSVVAAARALAEGLGIDAADRVPLVFPMSHVGGAVWLAVLLMTGCRGLLTDRFDRVTTMEFLEREGMTVGAGGTSVVMEYLAYARARPGRRVLPDVRLFVGGAAPKSPDLHDELGAVFGGQGLLSSWGMTECPIATCGRPEDPDDLRRRTEGRASPAVEVTALLPDGARAALGQEGELAVRGPQLFAGYVGGGRPVDQDGLFHTGDLGTVDRNGFVTITGRQKDVIIRKGESISAAEIEALLRRHPAVADVAVIGLPDPRTGERVCAVVVPAETETLFTFDQMTGYLREAGLMVQKVPEEIRTLDALPRNATGKIAQRELRARIGADEA